MQYDDEIEVIHELDDDDEIEDELDEMVVLQNFVMLDELDFINDDILVVIVTALDEVVDDECDEIEVILLLVDELDDYE